MNRYASRVKFAFVFFVFTIMVSTNVSAQYSTKYDADFYFFRAKWSIYQGNYTSALADLNTVVSLNPNDANAYNTRGVVNEKCGDYAAAQADYEQALSIHPDSAEAKHNLINLRIKFKGEQIPGTSSARGTMLPYNGVYPQSSYERSPAPVSSYSESIYTPPTKSNYQKPIMRTNNNVIAKTVPENSYTPGNTIITTGNSQTEIRQQYVPPATVTVTGNSQPEIRQQYGQTAPPEYTVVVTPAPVQTFSPPRYSQPVIAAALPRTASAGRLQLPKEPVVIASDQPFIDPVASAYNGQGIMFNDLGRYDEAIIQFTEALRIYPNYAIAYNNRGVSYAGKGDFTSAVADFTQALRLNPYYSDANVNREQMMLRVAAFR